MKETQVVCGTSLEPSDAPVADRAAELARSLSAPLVLVHVEDNAEDVDASSVPPQVAGAFETMRTRVSERTERAHHALAQEQHRLSSVCAVSTELLRGHPADALLAYIASHGARILVVGTHIPRGAEKLFGTTAERVTRRATAPVLVIPPTAARDALSSRS